MARALIFLIAYPPAHGADSADYFLYAAQFEGLDAPIVFELIYPLYPLLIYLTHYWLGSVYVLIVFQLVLSALQGVVFYWGIRPYSPALAFGVALLVLADPQTGILHNFTSTEPLYMFTLSLAFSLTGAGGVFGGLTTFFSTPAGNLIALLAALITVGAYVYCYQLAQRGLVVRRVGGAAIGRGPDAGSGMGRTTRPFVAGAFAFALK